MKIKPGYVLREVAGQIVVVPVGQEALNLNGLITLNKSGKILWDRLQSDVTKEQLVEALLSKYDVSKEVVTKDIEEFLSVLQNKNILE